MFDLIKLLFEICQLKKAPQDLPYSINVLKILLVANIFINFLQSNISVNWIDAVLKAAIGVLLIGGFSWISLFFRGKLTRFYQTTAALLGTDTLIGILTLPVIATMSIGQGGTLTFLVMIALIIWYWVVTGHIMRNALDESFGFSLGLSFLYLLISYQVTAFIIS
jgi:hypothetical protein